MSVKIENYWKSTTPAVGNHILADGWGKRNKTWGPTLKKSDWDGCQFRILMGDLMYNQAVNIRITGRTVQYDSHNAAWVRIKIEFVGDGEPSTFSGGWMKVN